MGLMVHVTAASALFCRAAPGHVDRHHNQSTLNLGECVGRIFWDQEKISFRDMPRGSPVNACTCEVLRVQSLLVAKLAARRERSPALDYVEDLRFLLVHIRVGIDTVN